jgi:hypothetical protein
LKEKGGDWIMKMSKLIILNIVLATMLVTSMFLLNIRSISVDKTANAGDYDPWKDINDDGSIEMMDFFYLSQAYGTSGDPSKPVNVTNFPLDEEGNLKVVTGTGAMTWHNATFVYDIVNSVPSFTEYVSEDSLRIGGGVYVLSEAQFDFQPVKEPFIVSDMWVTGLIGAKNIQVTPELGFENLCVNGLQTPGGASGTYPTYFGIHIRNDTVLQSIMIGSNSVLFEGLTIDPPFFWRITVHITYAYLG